MKDFIKTFEGFLKKEIDYDNPRNLYEPVKYLLDSGGKRLRPLITLFVSDLFTGNISNALPASAALEIFHNFTLAHDDIMDNSLMRRGKKTINSKWDDNTAILSGDVMLIISYEILNKYDDSKYLLLSKQLTETSRLVCEGQQNDMDFSIEKNISEDDYFKMIENKTAVLIGCSFMFGAIVSELNSKEINALYEVGKNLGLAFQLEDDLLDCFGDESKFGKKIGGDIIQKKKTLLFIHTLSKLDNDKRLEFENIFFSDNTDESVKISLIKKYYKDSGAVNYINKKVKEYSEHAKKIINQMQIDDNKKLSLNKFSEQLLNREI
ncbi:MAG: polyprenyl synthetase family protein [Pelagibacterales bacterium]|jgi:geranylgeranyl diphosphate synthase type II|nr:polyprenyl synthetase family protein [Pelagibacterales bacterium]MBL6876703.1 polyprenyl synthetase family protein [Flavobacteriales bacterium]